MYFALEAVTALTNRRPRTPAINISRMPDQEEEWRYLPSPPTLQGTREIRGSLPKQVRLADRCHAAMDISYLALLTAHRLETDQVARP